MLKDYFLNIRALTSPPRNAIVFYINTRDLPSYGAGNLEKEANKNMSTQVICCYM